MWRIVLTVMLIFSYHVFSETGDRARKVCNFYGTRMPQCKIKLYGSKNRIPAKYLEFPHMALVGFRSCAENKWLWKCGGSLISPLWVLTAAHCLNDLKLGLPQRVLFGKNTFISEEQVNLIQIRKIVKHVKHPNHTTRRRYNDIALLKLNKPIRMRKGIQIACLHTRPEIPVKGIASGFGKTSYTSSNGSATLMKVELEIIPQEKCNASLKSLIKKTGQLNEGILKTQLCAGDLEHGGKDTCQGDSGGPFQYLLKNPDCKESFPLFMIFGVTSFGRFCGFRNSPGVYTRVSEYVEWIEDIVWPYTNRTQ